MLGHYTLCNRKLSFTKRYLGQDLYIWVEKLQIKNNFPL